MKLASFGFLLLCCAVHTIRGDEFHFDPGSEDDKTHLKDDLDGVIDKNINEMNQNELQFHYFRQHDFDNNEKLDGIELMGKLFQDHADKVKKGESDLSSLTLPDEYIHSKIHSFLKSNDLNGDGYVDFAEYAKGSELAQK